MGISKSYLKDKFQKKQYLQTGDVVKPTTEYKPTLQEFRDFYENVPSYNYGYESTYDSNPRMAGVQPEARPLTKEAAQRIQSLPTNKEAKERYLGKTFGTLPVIQGAGTYLGYSPNRTWVGNGPYYQYDDFNRDKPGVQAKRLESNPSYLYLLAPKDQKTLSTINEDIRLSTGQSSAYGSQLVNNPEIVEYAKQKGIDLNDFSTKNFSDYENRKNDPDIRNFAKQNVNNQFSESMLASRNRLNYPIGTATAGGTVIQDPTQFNLMGYLPVDLDLYQDWQDNEFTPNTYDPLKSRSYSTSINDPLLRQIYLNKAGVPNDPNIRKNILFHTNAFPIQQYKPRTNAQGEIYKDGGQVKSKLKTSYKNKRG